MDQGSFAIFSDYGLAIKKSFMQKLSGDFKAIGASPAKLSQSPALEVAMRIRLHWNRLCLPLNLIKLAKYLLILFCLYWKPVMAQIPRQPFSEKARWITTTMSEDSIHPCPLFRKSFDVHRQVRSAMLYITAHGIYEATINTRRVGKGYFTPGFTSYDKRLQWQQYNVTGLLQKTNEIVVTIGDGWWRGVFGGDLARDRYGRDASLLFEIKITYTDGSYEEIISDKSWKASTGKILYANIYQGELQDTRIHAKDFVPVTEEDFDHENLVETIGAPVTKQEKFKPQKIFAGRDGGQIIDFGQNMAGWVQISIQGRSGDTIKISHAESLDRDGNFYTGNLRDARATDEYILNGKKQILEPHFTYHGFRYAKVKGFTVTKENCTAIALHTDLKHTGNFSCSSSLINKLQHNIEWSLNSNFFDIPTDCPQRSERLGWSGDAGIFCATAAFNRDVRRFFEKWLDDLRADQGINGGVPVIIPDIYHHGDSIKRGVAGWGDAATIIPWTLFQIYGDTNILRRQYPSMKAWVDYIESRSANYLWKTGTYGDWYAPGPSTNPAFIDQCFFGYSTQLVNRAAGVLDQKEDKEKYSDLLKKIKGAFLKAYSPLPETQTAHILALQFNMLPDSLRDSTAKHLADLIHKNSDHLATGFLGTPHILRVLSDHGYNGLAYAILNQSTIPSWLYPIIKGATTIWEKWDAIKADGSFDTCSLNHYAYGAVGQWLYEEIAGIRAAAPGYKKIIIQPHPGGGLTWAKASCLCPYGKIVSEWKIKDQQLSMHVIIPQGTSATVRVPGQGLKAIGPGNDYN